MEKTKETHCTFFFRGPIDVVFHLPPVIDAIQKNNKLVWNESVRFTQEMLESWGTEKPEVVIDHCLDFTKPVSTSYT